MSALSNPIKAGRFAVILAWLCLLSFSTQSWAENRIEVVETFYRLTFDEELNAYRKTAIDTARPGDLIELRITATNIGQTTARDIELINSVPKGNAELIPDSFSLDEANSEYRLSPNDERFFPPNADIPPESIRYVQWLIFELKPGQSSELSYRLRLPN